VSGRWAELIGGPFRASWRAALGWSLAFVVLIVSTMAFWPAFRGSSGITAAIDQLPTPLLSAFGLQGFGSPAGYLRGGLYELVMPLCFAAAGVLFANSATAAEEESGRLELFVSQPVSRAVFFTGRAIAVFAWLAVLTLVALAVQLASDQVFGVPIDTGHVAATVVLCGLLGALLAGLCLAVAGVVDRPQLALSAGLGVAYVSYLVLALFPLSSLLAPWRQIGPWGWALGGDPLVNGGDAWRYVLLGGPAVLLAALGVVAFDRRDIRSA
jgi:ABC-2 type transport system permease protein